MQADWTGAVSTALLLCAVLAPSHALASDNNEDPPYMIYINPETGKYTTKDPLAHRPTDYDPQAAASPPVRVGRRAVPGDPGSGGKADRYGTLVAGALLLFAAAAAAWRFRSRRGGRALRGP